MINETKMILAALLENTTKANLGNEFLKMAKAANMDPCTFFEEISGFVSPALEVKIMTIFELHFDLEE